MKNKSVPNDFDSIQTNHMTIGRVKTVNHLGLVIDENLYWNAHVDFVCASLVKYFGIFNLLKMKPMKAPGHDSIGTKIIYLCPDIFAENLSKIFNNAILQGVYPDAMKIAKVIAFLKGE